MNTEQYLKNLETPRGKIDVILDTDAYNEIDDQFALAYLLCLGERIRTVGICAAPFLNPKSTSAEDGMEKSYNEILKILELTGREDLKSHVYRGSTRFMESETQPVKSDAASYMAAEAEKYSPENPLYIVALGAITNVASAILENRQAMCENTVVVWLGGHAKDFRNTKEFNMKQDYAAARIVFGCGAPVVQLPCMGVVSEFRTTRYELEHWLLGKNAISDYLTTNTIREAESYAAGKAWSRCIWDVTAVAWLDDTAGRYFSSHLMPAPIPQYDGYYSFDPARHLIRYVERVNRDALFTDLFQKLAAYGTEK